MSTMTSTSETHIIPFVLYEFQQNQEKLDILAKCYCCNKHSIHKPSIYKPWFEIPRNKKSSTNSNTGANGVPICKCSCRHEARFICRNHPDHPDNE